MAQRSLPDTVLLMMNILAALPATSREKALQIIATLCDSLQYLPLLSRQPGAECEGILDDDDAAHHGRVGVVERGQVVGDQHRVELDYGVFK